MNTGFTQMMMAEAGSGGEDSKIHGPAATQHWAEHYDDITGLILQIINVRSARWFFCKPVEG